MFQVVVQQFFGVLIVVIYYIFVVLFGGGRVCVFVENCFDIVEFFVSYNLDQEVFFIYIVCDIQIYQVYKFGVVFQVVYYQNIGDVFIIQGFNDVAVDKVCVVGNDDYNCNF